MKTSNLKRLANTIKDKEWGTYVTSCGYQEMPQTVDNNGMTPFSKPMVLNLRQGCVVGEYQLLYITKGGGSFESAHCSKVKIAEGSLILIFPWEWHRFMSGNYLDWGEYYICFNGMNIRKLMSSGFFDVSNPVFDIGINDFMVGYYMQIIDIIESGQLYYQQFISGILVNMLGNIYYDVKNSIYPSKEIVEKINKACALMKENVSNPLSATEVSQRLGFGYSWFRKAFKKYTGMSPAKYQLHLRLRKAKKLLLETDLSVSEIAYDLSFDTPGQFSTFFKRKTGNTPKEFRSKKHGKRNKVYSYACELE